MDRIAWRAMGIGSKESDMKRLSTHAQESRL